MLKAETAKTVVELSRAPKTCLMQNWANHQNTPLELFMTYSIGGATVLLLGGSGGIGAALADILIERGAASVIIASKNPVGSAVSHQKVALERVDVADWASVRKLADSLFNRDISIVINCAGVNGNQRLVADNSLEMAHREMAVNYFGVLHVAKAFGPILAARGGGVYMQVLSFLSHINLPMMASYCASKAAAHSLTQALRAEWRCKGIKVCGVYPTAVDTTMSQDVRGPKMLPAELAREMVNSLVNGDEDLFPGDAKFAYADFLRDPKALEVAMAGSVESD